MERYDKKVQSEIHHFCSPKTYSGNQDLMHLLNSAVTPDMRFDNYMLNHRGDDDASELWQTFSKIIEWVRGKFITYNAALKSFNWGEVYNEYHNGVYNGNIIHKNASEINEEIIQLINDDEVTATTKGIYQYIIYGDGKYLQIRQFDEKTAHDGYGSNECFGSSLRRAGEIRLTALILGRV